MGRVSDFLNAQLGQDSQTRIGIAGFTTFARVRNVFSYTSEVPTTFLEDGSSVEDTIILNPVTLTIEGDVADVYQEETALQELINTVASSAGTITAYLPERTQSQQQTVVGILADVGNAIDAADELLAAGGQVAALFGSGQAQGKSLQEAFIDTIESLHFGKQLVDIEMPFRTFSNMRIQCEITVDNQTKKTSFKIDATEVRTADQAVSSISSLITNPSPAINGQGQSQTDKGVQEGTPEPSSLLNTVLGLGG